MTEAGAKRLAGTITGYWRERGYYANVWPELLTLTAEMERDRDSRRVWQVRSDMVDGHPLRRLVVK